MPAATLGYLASVNPATTDVYGVGGPGYNAVRGAFPAWNVTPLKGDDRFATTAAVAGSKLFAHASAFGLATGYNFPDALAGGALAGALHAPVLLTDGDAIPAGEAAWLTSPTRKLTMMTVFGQTGAVSNAAENAAGDLAFGAGNWDPHTAAAAVAAAMAAATRAQLIRG